MPISVPSEKLSEIAERCESSPGYQLTATLETQLLADDSGFAFEFEIDPFRKHLLLEGLDDIGLILQHEKAISDYEHSRAKSQL